jgi:hypothetical protein
MHCFYCHKCSLTMFIARLICLFSSQLEIWTSNHTTYEIMFYNFESSCVCAMDCLYEVVVSCSETPGKFFLSWPNQGKGLERCESRVHPGNHIHTPTSVRECEGMSPHTPKWTPTLGDGVFMKSQMFKEWF